MPPIRNPSLDEFLTCARHEFGFLIAEFGFQEQALRGDADVNRYQVQYVNAIALVKAEGINWGYGVNVLLGPSRQPISGPEDTFPLWPIVKLRRPDLYDGLNAGDQLEQLAAHAMALRACAADVLRGSFDIRGEVVVLLEQELSSESSGLDQWAYRRDVEIANQAFLSKDYQRVIDVLAPHRNKLSPSLRLKLEYAKRHRQ